MGDRTKAANAYCEVCDTKECYDGECDWLRKFLHAYDCDVQGKTIKCGENFYPKKNDVLHMASGVFVSDKEGLFVVVKPFVAVMGKDGLHDVSNKPIDLHKYAVRVTEEAKQEYVEHNKN